MQAYRHTARSYERDNFSIENAVKELLERHDSNKALCLHELSQTAAYVQERLKGTVQRHYPKFIESANKVETAAQCLLKMREQIATLKGTVQQVADMQLCDPAEVKAGEASDAAGGSAGHTDHPGGEASQEETRLKEIKESIDLAVYEYDFEKAADIVLSALAEAQVAEVSAVYERALWRQQEAVASNIVTALTNTPALSNTLLKLLLKLGRAQLAYKIFFSHRSEWVRSEVRRVRFVGDMPEYAKSAANAVFRGLAATYVEFTDLAQAAKLRSGSAAVRWLATEIYDFSFLLKSQIFSVEAAADVFRALSEVFKACRDHLEPLSIDLLPHLRQTLEESALDMLERECLFMKQSCNCELDEDDFMRKPSDEFEEIHAPPLWTRAARNERLNVVVSGSVQHLVLAVCTLLGNVRTACLHAPEGSTSSRATDRPWTVLEEPTDRIIAETVRHYIQEVFERPALGKTPSQMLLMLSNVRFLVEHFLVRLSAVMHDTFHRKRITNIDELIDKSVNIPNRLLVSLAKQWAESILPDMEGEAEGDVGAYPVLPVVLDVIQNSAVLQREALIIFSDRSMAESTVRAFAERLVACVTALPDLSAASEHPRDVRVLNTLVLQRGLARYTSDEIWAPHLEALQMTQEEVVEGERALAALHNEELEDALHELRSAETGTA